MQLPSKFGDDPSPDGRGQGWEPLPHPVVGTLFFFRSTPLARPGIALCSFISRPIALIFSGHTVTVEGRLGKSSAGSGEAGWRRWAPAKVSVKLVLDRARAQVGRPGGVGWLGRRGGTKRGAQAHEGGSRPHALPLPPQWSTARGYMRAVKTQGREGRTSISAKSRKRDLGTFFDR